MAMLRRLFISAAAAVLVATTQASFAAADQTPGHALAQLRVATFKYHDLDKATDAGYGRFVDVNGIACIAEPGMGAMGVHYVNGDLVGDPAIIPTQPEALVYAPTAHGKLRLAAVEYVVVKAAWDATHSSPPELYGQTFNFADAPNRYGLPPFYSLHVWIWKHNPAGMFEMWNPKVVCPS
jgi:hypothetical protein